MAAILNASCHIENMTPYDGALKSVAPTRGKKQQQQDEE